MVKEKTTNQSTNREEASRRRKRAGVRAHPSPNLMLKRAQELSHLSQIADKGMSFEDEIGVIRAQNELKRLIATGRSLPPNRIQSFGKRLSVTQKASEEAIIKVNKMRSESPILLLDGRREREAQEAMTKRYRGLGEKIIFRCPEPARKWYFDFWGGAQDGVTNVYDVTDGYVGWRGVPRIQNPNADQATTTVLHLLWHRNVPKDGTFSYWVGAPDVWLKLRYKLWGSGVWSTDASLAIKIFTWISVGAATLEGYSETLVDETKEAAGSKTGTIDRWIPVGTNGMFRGMRDQSCWVVIQLQIQHWYDTGGVWVEIDDFCYPSVDPNTDIALAD